MDSSVAILKSRFKSFQVTEAKKLVTMPTGIAECDRLGGGIPRGAITEVVGTASSGRTTLLYSLLAGATNRQEVCAVIDTADTLVLALVVL